MRIIQKQTKTKSLIILLAGILLLSGIYFGYAYSTKSIWPFAQTAQEDSLEENGVNYSLPTEQEIASSQDAKKNTSPQDSGNAQQQAEGQKRTVSVGIAFAGYDSDERAIDVRAFTPDVIEGNGTCTATFTLGANTVSESSKAFIDSSSSQCEPILIPESRFSTKGTWKLIVSYESDESAGSSPAMSVEIGQ